MTKLSTIAMYAGFVKDLTYDVEFAKSQIKWWKKHLAERQVTLDERKQWLKDAMLGRK